MPLQMYSKTAGRRRRRAWLGNLEIDRRAAEHNHGARHPSGCTGHRRAELKKPEVKAELEKEWRKGSKVSNTLRGLRMDNEQLVFKPQDL